MLGVSANRSGPGSKLRGMLIAAGAVSVALPAPWCRATAGEPLRPPPLVHIDTGNLSGRDNGGAYSFRGVPYAAPPVGDLRWRPPQSPAPWDGVRDAGNFAPDCPGLFPAHHKMSEDCLYLNVWTPGLDKANRPVMVWIYGGGFAGGSADMPMFDGAALARHDVVLVTFGYRTGSLGFLATPELAAESPTHAAGNYGLMDVLAVLRWVKANISAFGGNPDNVTLFGQSSGSESVNILTASPLARGLFQKGIGLSGSSFGVRRAPSLATAEIAGRQFMASRHATSLAQLRAMDWHDLLAHPDEKFEPNIDGWLLPADVYATYRAGKQNDVPLIVGNTSQEWPRPEPLTPAQFRTNVESRFGNLASTLLAWSDIPDEQHATDAQWNLTNIEWGDFPAATWAGLQARTGRSPIWRYLFDYAPPAPAGQPRIARHGSDLPYIFDSLDRSDAIASVPSDLAVRDTMLGYVLNFVRHGDPNGPGLPHWTAAARAPADVLRLRSDGARMVPERDPRLVALLHRHYYSDDQGE